MYKQKLRILSRLLGLTLTACLVGGLLAPAAYAAEGGEQVEIKSLRATSMVRKDGKQEVEATLNNGGAAFDAYAKVTVGEESPYMAELGEVKAGQQTVIIPVTDTHDMLEPGETTTLTVELYNNGRGSGRALGSYTDDQWARTRHWEIYLCQEMHTDLGYTAYQEDLKNIYSGYLDTVKEYMENSDNRETDLQKYKYAIESSFMLGEAYLQKRNADQVQWLIDRVKEGRMEIGAGQFNYTMENFSTEEAARATYYSNRFLVDKLGVQPSQTQRMFDNPAFSKSYVDFAASAGIKYGFHSMNPDRSPYYKRRQYDLFYMQGNDPNNKLLVFNGKHYADNYGFGGSHFDTEGSVEEANDSVLSLFRELEAKVGRTAYPYDKFPMLLVPYADNQRPMEEQVIVANGLNKKWDEEGYAYPRVKTAFPDEFFQDVEAEYGDMIPVETGTEENWWNDGWGTTAYESGTNKRAGTLIPVAETAASFSSLFGGAAYPYNDIYDAVEYNLIYDEHTWGSSGYNDSDPGYHKQFEWKRTNAFAAKNLAEKVLSGSLDSLASTVPTAGKAIYVYNPLNWERDDVVTVEDISGFPEHFAIKDGDTSIPYTVEDGKLTFVAPAIPAMGYKTFAVEEITAAPSFESKVTAGEDYIENDYYKVTFAADGTISSILDKQNGNRELVDGASEAKFNQYQYYDDHGLPNNSQGTEFTEDTWTLYRPEEEESTLNITETAVGATATLDTSTFRADSIVQKVTLYNDMPRIDIENTVVKSALPDVLDKEEAFYTFPFKAEDGYEIRYDLPAGNTAEGDQIYGTSTEWYTASKWVNVQDTDGYNMALALPDTSLLQFGERRTGNWSFDYKSENPYIYSYVMNNMWWTNFQGDQPGAVTFTYAISTNKGEGMEDTARFGWEVSYPLQATVIAGAQAGSAAASDSYLDIDNENVQLTTMKTAEANDDGMILRFHEIGGSETGKVTVTLPFQVESVTETNVIEEDMEQVAGAGNTFTFELGAYGVKTFRIRFGEAPATVTGLEAVTSGEIQGNLSIYAAVTASSEYDGNFKAENALEIGNGQEWASKSEKNPWLELTWKEPIVVGRILISDRPNTNDNIVSIDFTFSDGSKLHVDDIPQDGTVKEIVLESPKTITSARLDISSEGGNIGLQGVEFYPPDNGGVKTAGTQLTWEPVDGALYYEIFRSVDPDFTAGSGNYVASAQTTGYYDTQVVDGMERTYYYKVRAVGAGAKGAASDAATPKKGSLSDTVAPETPVLHATPRLGTRVDLDWVPVNDNVELSHYEIYRNGELLAQTTDNYVCTYRDKAAEPNTTYTYMVKAVDTAGNVSESQAVSATTLDTLSASLSGLTVSMGTLSPGFDPATRFYSLNLGDNFGRFDGVTVTATAMNPEAKIYVNGVETASGAESALAPLQNPGDKIKIKVVEGERTKIYTLTAGTDEPILEAVDAIAGDYYDVQVPSFIIDGSGLTGDDLSAVHDNHVSAFTMWHTNANPGEKAWVQIDLGQPYPLDEMYIWNMNQQNNTGRGFKNVKIEYSTDGDVWQTLEPEEGMTFAEEGAEGYPFQLAQATGEDAMAATNLNDGSNTPVRFGGVKARYVKITAHPEVGVGSWGDVYFGLSEVRITSKLELRDLVPVTSIQVSAEGGQDAITEPGGSLQMTAEVQPADATKRNVTWSVANPDENIAVISEDGLLSAHRNGTVKVIATAKDGTGVTGTATITVSGQPEVIEGVTAKAGEVYDQWNTPEGVVDGEGMSGKGSVYDTHDNNGNGISMWHTKDNPGANAWIEFDLGSVQPVGQMWIWNMNQNNNADRGLRNVKIEYRSSESDAWTALEGDGEGEYDFTLAQASGKSNQPATNLIDGRPVELNLETRFIRIAADPVAGQGNYGSNYYGLSEVRFTVGEQSQPDRTLEEAKAAAEKALADLQVSNHTTEEDILEAVTAAVDNPAVTVSVSEGLALTPATDEAAGSIMGQISLTYDGEEALVEVDLTIPALGGQIVPGDLDKDGEVTIADVMEACKVMARESAGTDPTDDEIARGDLDGDGEITIADVMEICKILARQG